jgi:NMT1-like family
MATRYLIAACAGAAALACASGAANAQTLGFAAMQPGTINHTTSSAISKVLKEKGGINALVQATAGESVMIAIVGRGEAEFAMANAPELGIALANNGRPDIRIIGPIYTLKTGFWVRKDSNMRTIADLRGKRVTMGYSAMRALEPMSRAILATGGLNETDIRPVLVPNVVRSADDFVGGAADMFMFAFGAPKVREVDVLFRNSRIPGNSGGAQGSALRLPDRRRTRPDLRRRRKTDEGLHHRQHPVHSRQGARRGGIQGDRDNGGQQGRDDRRRSEPARVLGGRAQQEI